MYPVWLKLCRNHSGAAAQRPSSYSTCKSLLHVLEFICDQTCILGAAAGTSLILPVLNMYTLSDPDHTGGVHMWSLSEPSQPPHGKTKLAEERSPVWDSPSVIYSSRRIALIIPISSMQISTQQATSCLWPSCLPGDLFCINLCRNIYHSICHGQLETGGLLWCQYLNGRISVWNAELNLDPSTWGCFFSCGNLWVCMSQPGHDAQEWIGIFLCSHANSLNNV